MIFSYITININYILRGEIVYVSVILFNRLLQVLQVVRRAQNCISYIYNLLLIEMNCI